MDRSTAHGLAGGGALLVAVSLLLPWYSVTAAGVPGKLGTTSGWESLGALRWVVLALALAAGVRAAKRVLPPQLAQAGAIGLLLVIGLRFSSPPAFGDAFADALPTTGDALGDAFGRVLLTSLEQQAGLELQPAIGMGLAAAGAAMALWGALSHGR